MSETHTDIDQTKHGHAETSVGAFNSVSDQARESQRKKIITYLGSRQRFGATCEEVEHALRLLHSSASARLLEIRKDSRVVIRGTRKTLSGRSARVYKLPEFAETFAQ